MFSTYKLIIFALFIVGLLSGGCGDLNPVQPRQFPTTCSTIKLANKENTPLFIRQLTSMDGTTTGAPRTINLAAGGTTEIPITGDAFYHFIMYRSSTMNASDEIARFIIKNSNIGLTDVCSIQLRRDGTFPDPGKLSVHAFTARSLSMLHTSIISPQDWDLQNPRPDILKLDYGAQVSVPYANDRFKHIYLYQSKRVGETLEPDLTTEIVRLKIYNNNPQHVQFSEIRIVYP